MYNTGQPYDSNQKKGMADKPARDVNLADEAAYVYEK